MTHRAILSCVLAFAMGCNGEVETIGGPGPTPEAPPTGSGAPRIENPTPPAPPPPSHSGFVYVHTFEYQQADQTSFGVYGDAWFGLPTAAAGKPLSGCELTVYSVDDGDTSPAQPEPLSDDAGSIDVTVPLGVEKDDFQIFFNKKAKLYEMFTRDTEGPATGTIRFRAPGGAVPAFTVDLVPQAPLKIVAPVLGTKVGARDLPVTFTLDPEAEFAIVTIGAFDKEIRCAAAKGTSEVVVPAALMTQVLDDERSTGLSLWVYAGKSKQVDVGDYRVRVQHSSSVYTSVLKE